MISFALSTVIAPSLADPVGSSPLVAAVNWLNGVALGAIATSIALIAVASVGLMMLAGRLPVRRGATVIAGCFILFGAPSITAGILSALSSSPSAEFQGAHPLTQPPLPSTVRSTPTYDPYAGAAVPPR